jgi:hypothetical protein
VRLVHDLCWRSVSLAAETTSTSAFLVGHKDKSCSSFYIHDYVQHASGRDDPSTGHLRECGVEISDLPRALFGARVCIFW